MNVKHSMAVFSNWLRRWKERRKPNQISPINTIRKMNRPELKGRPTVLMKNTSKPPASVGRPGMMPTRMDPTIIMLTTITMMPPFTLGLAVRR